MQKEEKRDAKKSRRIPSGSREVIAKAGGGGGGASNVCGKDYYTKKSKGKVREDEDQPICVLVTYQFSTNAFLQYNTLFFDFSSVF